MGLEGLSGFFQQDFGRVPVMKGSLTLRDAKPCAEILNATPTRHAKASIVNPCPEPPQM